MELDIPLRLLKKISKRVHTLTFDGSLLIVPYDTQTNPDSFTTLTSLGLSTSGSADVTTPSRFQRDANRIASCRLLARISPTGCVPESVRNRTGIDGCLKERRRQMSGLKLEKIMFRPFPRS
jgi:hypothetical protein